MNKLTYQYMRIHVHTCRSADLSMYLCVYVCVHICIAMHSCVCIVSPFLRKGQRGGGAHGLAVHGCEAHAAAPGGADYPRGAPRGRLRNTSAPVLPFGSFPRNPGRNMNPNSKALIVGPPRKWTPNLWKQPFCILDARGPDPPATPGHSTFLAGSLQLKKRSSSCVIRHDSSLLPRSDTFDSTSALGTCGRAYECI